MAGHEGIVGIELALGIASAPLTAIVQEGGTALRADAEDFGAEMVRNHDLRTAVDRFVHVTLRQMAASSACLRTHQLSPRLTRWLLMTQDRAGARSIHVTQELLAQMLGVRRVAITSAAKEMAAQRADRTTSPKPWPNLELFECNVHQVFFTSIPMHRTRHQDG